MRTAFIASLEAQAAQDERVWLVTGDIGFSVLERFAERFPERFLNAGIAEQNMMGVAAGLALSGNIVYVYSIANFTTMRCIEQIRNDVCYHNLPVRIISVGGGFCYATQGYTHHALEDLGIMRTLPNLSVLAPGDPVEARLCVEALGSHPGPAYMRLGKAGEPVLHQDTPPFGFGRMIPIREEGDYALISSGGMLEAILESAERIESRTGRRAALYSMPFIKPLDREAVEALGRRMPLIISVEEHSVIGGLGSALAEVLATTSGMQARLLTYAAKDAISSTIGDQCYLREQSCGNLDAFVLQALESLS